MLHTIALSLFLGSVFFSSIAISGLYADEFVSEAEIVQSAGSVTQEEFRRTEIEAQNRITGTSQPETDAKSAAAGGGGPTYVITTEKIPGAKCDCIADGAKDTTPSDGVGPPTP